MKIVEKIWGKMIDRRIAEYQSDLIEKHCEEVQHIVVRQIKSSLNPQIKSA